MNTVEFSSCISDRQVDDIKKVFPEYQIGNLENYKYLLGLHPN